LIQVYRRTLEMGVKSYMETPTVAIAYLLGHRPLDEDFDETENDKMVSEAKQIHSLLQGRNLDQLYILVHNQFARGSRVMALITPFLLSMTDSEHRRLIQNGVCDGWSFERLKGEAGKSQRAFCSMSRAWFNRLNYVLMMIIRGLPWEVVRRGIAVGNSASPKLYN